jgi:hypothetical protein
MNCGLVSKEESDFGVEYAERQHLLSRLEA